jgi:hypothetical protein
MQANDSMEHLMDILNQLETIVLVLSNILAKQHDTPRVSRSKDVQRT